MTRGVYTSALSFARGRERSVVSTDNRDLDLHAPKRNCMDVDSGVLVRELPAAASTYEF